MEICHQRECNNHLVYQRKGNNKNAKMMHMNTNLVHKHPTKTETKLTTEYRHHNQMKSKQTQQHFNGSNCNELKINDKTIDYKLRSVANHLVYLIQDPSKHLVELQSFKQDRSRIRGIFQIYSKLLDLKPIETSIPRQLSLRPCQGQQADHTYRHRSLVVARQQVLNYIEKLNGYCDSINLLRCILKSSTMIGVMEAFDGILKAVEIYQANLKERPLSSSSLWSSASALGDDDYSQSGSFKIMTEWTV